MSGMKGLTTNTPPEAEAHVFAEDDAAIYAAMFGPDGVSTMGSKCAATVLSNNKVRISDGIVCVGGHFARIPYGEYEDCEIVNGQSGKNRNDIIVAKFVTTGNGGIDAFTCEVKQGVAGTTAVDPILTQDDLYKSGKIREFPLYRVKIQGLSIVAVEQMFNLVRTNKELEEALDELNSKIEMYIITREDISINDAWKVLEYHCEKIGNMVFLNIEIFTSSYQANYKYENVLTIRNSDLKPVSNTPLNATGYDAGFGNGVVCGCIIKDDGTMYVTIPQTGRGYVVINAAYRVA